MIQIIIGSFLLSVLHASIPNHWLPVVAISRAEKWTRRETLIVTGISGFAHTLSTVLIGIVVGFIGNRLSEKYHLIAEKAGPTLLITIGIIYVIIDILKHNKHSHNINEKEIRNRSKWAIMVSLTVAMFLSPCLEIEAFYFQAGVSGWPAIIIVSVIYVTVTVAGMLLLVDLGARGVKKIKSHFLDHHEKLLSGIILIVLGIIAWFVHF